MATSVVTAPTEARASGASNLRQTFLMACGFAACMALQAAGYSILGTGQAGLGVSEVMALVQHGLAITGAVIAFRRAQGTSRWFWFLFGTTIVVLLIPSVVQTSGTFLGHNLLSDRTWRALYTLYGAPVLMMLVLPDSDRTGRARWEIFLDLFQIALAVTLVFSMFFYLPLQEMLPSDALEHNLTISNLVSMFLLSAVLLRLRFTRLPGKRDRLLRLGLFLFACGTVTFIGNWIDQHHFVTAAAWWDVGWDLPIVMAGLVSVSWKNSAELDRGFEPVSLVGIAGKNLTVVLIITCIHLVMDHTLDARGKGFTNIAVTLSLLAFTLRAVLTQHHQQEEIGRRQQAQNQLTAANGKIRVLLEDARRQTDEITQINEVGSLLQACSAPEEAYRLISERMGRLFPGASGTLALLNTSKNRVESVAEWGENPPTDQNFAPNECWALRRGCVHALADGASVLRCSHLRNNSSSVCIPLVAAGTAIGTLAIQGAVHRGPAGTGDEAAESAAFEHHRDLVVAVAEHISLALADLQLREALRTQAVRDPLTGLYNRRYMQEFLDRETHRARRKNRPLAVLALDLDHFKSFNDNYGHAAGDYVLSLVGDVLLHSVRADDVACRYGGEEFIMILPECNLQQAMRRAEQIRVRLQQRPMEYQGVTQKTITVSIGVAAFDETTDRIERLLRCADEALYEAKRAGRDRVVAARPIVNNESMPVDSAVSASL